MRIIDADELLINVWRDKPNDTVSIAKMINDAPTVKDIPTKEDAEPIADMDMTKIFMIGILLGYDKKQDEMDKFTEDIKRIFAPKPNTDVLAKIRVEIDRQEKWLMDAGYTAYNVDIAFSAIKLVVAEGSDTE